MITKKHFVNIISHLKEVNDFVNEYQKNYFENDKVKIVIERKSNE